MEMTVVTQHRTGTFNMAQLNNLDPVDCYKCMVGILKRFHNNRYLQVKIISNTFHVKVIGRYECFFLFKLNRLLNFHL